MYEIFKNAIRNKTPLEIIYWGGTQPGRKRQIQPVKIEADTIRAVCLTTGETKQYYIDRIDIEIQHHPDALIYNPGQDDPPYETHHLGELTQDLIDRIAAQGWHVKKTDCSLGVFLYFKNGKLRKTPEVELLCYSNIFPWYVRGRKTGPAYTFRNLRPALAHFLRLAQQMKAMANAPEKGV